MRKSIFTAILVLVVTLSTVPVHAMNMVENGGFESGNLTGWVANDIGISVHPTMWAYDGSYAAEISPHENLGTLKQLIPTETGKAYELSYYLRSAGGANEFITSIDGNKYMDLHNFGQDYTNYSFTFSAISPLTELAFASQQEFGAFLDNVTVTPVPEPATLLLLGAGLFGASFMKRRIKS